LNLVTMKCSKVSEYCTSEKYKIVCLHLCLKVGSITFRLSRALLWQGYEMQWRTQEFFLGRVSTNSVEDRENGDLEAVAP